MGKLGYGDTNNRGDDPGEMGDLLPYVDLGTGRTARQVFAGFNNSCAILDNYQVKCWGENEAGQLGQGNQNDKGDAPGEMGDNLIPIDFGTSERPIDVQIAELSICVLFESERVKCLGRGSYGVMMRGKDPGYVGNVVAELGEALNWINFGTGRRAQKIIAGQRHYCAVLDNAKVKCWGHNIHGDLGMGHFQSWGNSPSHLGDSWPYVDFGGF